MIVENRTLRGLVIDTAIFRRLLKHVSNRLGIIHKVIVTRFLETPSRLVQ